MGGVIFTAGRGVIFTAGLGVISTAGLGVIVTSWRLGLIKPNKAFQGLLIYRMYYILYIYVLLYKAHKAYKPYKGLKGHIRLYKPYQGSIIGLISPYKALFLGLSWAIWAILNHSESFWDR